MKPYKLKKDSWHYWLANFGNHRVNWNVDDICSYIRCVLSGTILFILTAIIVSGISGSILFTIANVFSWLFLGYELHSFALMICYVIGGILLSGLLIFGSEKIREKNETSEPGFARLAYRRFKEKSCARVEFE